MTRKEFEAFCVHTKLLQQFAYANSGLWVTHSKLEDTENFTLLRYPVGKSFRRKYHFEMATLSEDDEKYLIASASKFR